MANIQNIGLTGSLLSDRPAADRAEKMGLYGWLIGDWEMDAVYYPTDGGTRRSKGEIHFSWALQGRAIIDVWRVPGRNPDGPDDPSKSLMFGTTLRIYDTSIDAWHIVWSDPVKQYYSRQIGRAAGDDILQEGTDADGTAVRWRFTERKANSFHWIGERSTDQGKSWRREVEFFVRRTSAGEQEEKIMFDHVSIGVADLARSKRFYDAALTPLGYTLLSESETSLGYGQTHVSLWVLATDSPVRPDPKSGLHFCFVAPHARGVGEFYAAALATGGQDNGAPGVRFEYAPDYYAAYVFDPDGYRLEAYAVDEEAENPRHLHSGD